MAFEKSVLVPLNADDTFALITEPDRLRRWQVITARVDLRAGGDYRWAIIPGHSACGTITEVEPGRRVVFTWGWEGSAELPPGASTVTITLEPADGGTLVHLVHDGLAGEQLDNHAMGWDHYLGRLVRAAADGDAGPDEWGAVQDPGPVTAAEAALAVCQRVLRALPEADYHRPTVCTEFDVTQLAEHLIGSVTGLGGAAGAEGVPDTGATLEARVATVAQAMLEAWAVRGVDGTVKLGSHEMPAGLVLGIGSIEFLVHAWDFAQVTGQQVSVPDGLSQYVLDVAGQVITPEGRASGLFADPVQAGPDTGLLDRLIAFTGRSVSSAH
ncbi:MAG: TIGR03086 family metal-binding protein [Streptosporangiaceae bacterium]